MRSKDAMKEVITNRQGFIEALKEILFKNATLIAQGDITRNDISDDDFTEVIEKLDVNEEEAMEWMVDEKIFFRVGDGWQCLEWRKEFDKQY